MRHERTSPSTGARWGLAFALLLVPGVLAAQGTDGTTLEARADDQAGVRVEVVPQPVVEGQPVEFDVYFNTHSVDLGFDVREIAVLEDREGEISEPTSWEGSPPGGHHRSGRLAFPAVSGDGPLKLTLKGIGGVDRVFEWGEVGS